ncbi:NAD(P)-dependent oxidoreductase [Candidatus Pelagibacter sp.]|nr:NAD(P)-dependent oxidoreductase [Candidatus Pelagibacter sp.]
MGNIGLTGSTGSLGKTILKNYHKISFSKFKSDIRDKTALSEWIEKNKLDTIIHLAAIVPIKKVNNNKKKAREVNFLGTKNLVDICVAKKIKWFFFASTSHVYSSSKRKILESDKLLPISYYGKTKLLAEKYLIRKFKKNKINYCIGRIFSTTNNNQKRNYLVPDLKHKIKKVKKIKIKLENLNHFRDFISMDDLSKIIMFFLKKKITGIFNLGSGFKIHLKEIANLIAKEYNKEIIFKDNKKPTYLIANIKKIKMIYKFNISTDIKKKIFN